MSTLAAGTPSLQRMFQELSRRTGSFEGVRNWLRGKAFVDLSQKSKPNYGILDAVKEENSLLASNKAQDLLTGGLASRPYFHLKDRLVGGIPGAFIGYHAGEKLPDIHASTSQPRPTILTELLERQGIRPPASAMPRELLAYPKRLLGSVMGGYLGGKGLNSVVNVGRKYVANTSPLFGYDTKVIPKFSLKSLYEHGFLDKPMQGTHNAGGAGNPRYELLRRYLGIHKPDSTKDYFVKARDRSLRFNPRTFQKGNPAFEQYVRPSMEDPSLSIGFRSLKGQQALKPVKSPTAAPTPKPSAIITDPRAPAAPVATPKLILPGTPEPSKQSPGSFFSGEAAPRSQKLIKDLSENVSEKTPTYSLNRSELFNPPRYSIDQANNPFNSLFGSHDFRYRPGSFQNHGGGRQSAEYTLGDAWNLAIDPHEAPELKALLGGLVRTSPAKWKQYLNQPSAIGHPSSYGGDSAPVSSKLTNYLLRQVMEKVLRQQTPTIQQPLRLTYEAPSHFAVSRGLRKVSPSSIDFL